MKKIINTVLLLGIFVAVYFLATIFGNDLYMFGWLAYNFHFQWLICAAILILLLLKKRILAIFISIGNFIGIIGGQFIGDWIRDINIAKIYDEMSAEQKHQLSNHPGVFIWLLILLILTALGCALYYFGKEK